MVTFNDIRNLYTCEPYNGENVVILSTVMAQNGYITPIFLTARQASKLGGWIKNGECPTKIVYRSDERNSEFNYEVFNIAQVGGLQEYCSKLLKIMQFQKEVERPQTGLVLRKFDLEPLKIKRYFGGFRKKRRINLFSFTKDIVGISILLIIGLLTCSFNELTLWLFAAVGIYGFATF